jgi:pimeloyl-ACP methyl ester carboxylesterase
MTVDVLYLHGWGAEYPHDCPIKHELEQVLDRIGVDVKLHTPTYHPNEDVTATCIETFLADLERLAEQQPAGRFAAVVGCSFGGFLTSVLQERCPHLFGKAVLLAPAIDNFTRNYKDVPEEKRRMPEGYVAELRRLPARPSIRVPTVLLHGLLDDDNGGSEPWRVQEWAADNDFAACYYPEGVDHSMEPWLSGASHESLGVPDLQDLLEWALDEDRTELGAVPGGWRCSAAEEPQRQAAATMCGEEVRFQRSSYDGREYVDVA